MAEVFMLMRWAAYSPGSLTYQPVALLLAASLECYALPVLGYLTFTTTVLHAMLGSSRHCPEWRCRAPLGCKGLLLRIPTLHGPVRALSPTVSPCSAQYVCAFHPASSLFTGSSATDGS